VTVEALFHVSGPDRVKRSKRQESAGINICYFDAPWHMMPWKNGCFFGKAE